jgi:hypothetical protein
MASPAFIEIGGKRIPWRDVLELRREQRKAAAKAEQPALFELREDHRPAGDRSAGERYREPNLFTLLDRRVEP